MPQRGRRRCGVTEEGLVSRAVGDGGGVDRSRQEVELPLFIAADEAYSKGMKVTCFALVLIVCPLFRLAAGKPAKLPEMHWADESSGRPFSKDPSVIRFGGKYLMYYSLPGPSDGGMGGWSVGIAKSKDLVNWEKAGVVGPAQECDAKGLAAPAAWVHEGKVHLFYQTYGNGPKDAICHAWSEDGLNFTRNPENPVFAPTGDWTVGRAIDAEVFPVGDKLFLWFATRDPEMKIQMQGVASAPLDSDYGKKQWTQLGDGPILKPELPWETKCIEAASVMKRDGKLWMFYAGGYNNEPQQIGVASSDRWHPLDARSRTSR